MKKELKDKLAVADAKLGGIIKEKLEIKCFADSSAMELMRGIRFQLESLLTGNVMVMLPRLINLASLAVPL